MSVLSEAVAALDGVAASGWQREIAEALAAAMDESPNASTAKELRVLMSELTGGSVERKADVSDDLASKRAARRAAASS